MVKPYLTGLGVISPAGRGTDALWQACAAGGVKTVAISHFDDSQAPGHRIGLVALPPGSPAPGTMQRLIHLAQTAVQDALADAGLTGTADLSSTALVMAATDVSGAHVTDRQAGDHVGSPSESGPDLAESVAVTTGLQGPVLTVSTASASGCVALMVARDLIAAAIVDRVVVCGVDTITEPAFYGLAALRTLSRQGCRPFTAGRSGIRISECAGAIVLEATAPRPEHAERGGSRAAYGRLLGMAASNVASQGARPDVAGVVSVIEAALAEADCEADQVDYVNAHAAGTRQGDAAEIAALRAVLGERLRTVPLVSSKAATGHCQGAAGIVESMISIMTLARGEILPTLLDDVVDPAWEDLDFGPWPKSQQPQTALSISCGLGGSNAAVLLGREDGS